jgi:serine protease Do
MLKKASQMALLLMFLSTAFAETPNASSRKARESVFPALVHIQPIKEYFTGGEKRKVQITGSGVIFTADGYVLTNNHVAEKAQRVICTLSSKQEVSADVIGLDPWTDLAVLKLDLKEAGLEEVPFAQFGNSQILEVGQPVLALGSPLGLSRSLSMGVISSVDRYFDDEGEMISPFNLWLQTDAAINPGNSGGPLVNFSGEVIGINARAVLFGENLGFAIPINTAKYVVKQIIEKGEVERSWIGVSWQPIREYRKYMNQARLTGALIANVEKNSPAEKAGLKAGDLVTQINDTPFSAVYKEELPKIRLYIANLPIGSKIKFKLDTGEKRNVITQKQGKFTGSEYQADYWGISVKEITPRIVKNFQLESSAGVLISGVRRGSPADEAGVNRGFILTKIDSLAIKDLENFKQIYKRIIANKPKNHLLFLQFAKRNRFALIGEEDK